MKVTTGYNGEREREFNYRLGIDLAISGELHTCKLMPENGEKWCLEIRRPYFKRLIPFKCLYFQNNFIGTTNECIPRNF
jgi:hypothetical protein